MMAGASLVFQVSILGFGASSVTFTSGSVATVGTGGDSMVGGGTGRLNPGSAGGGGGAPTPGCTIVIGSGAGAVMGAIGTGIPVVIGAAGTAEGGIGAGSVTTGTGAVEAGASESSGIA